jgi:hypothetical protein
VQYTLSSNQIRLYIGQSKKIKVKTNASNKKFKVIWKSLNNKVAKISKNGKIQAVGKGKTRIYALINGKRYYCYVNILKKKPTYGEITRKAKTMNDSKNGITYKTVDAGNFAKLLGTKATSLFYNEEQLYILNGDFQPYINIVKNGSTAKINLKMFFNITAFSYEKFDVEYNYCEFISSNRRVKFSMPDYSENSFYNYKKDLYETDYQNSIDISSNTNKNTEKLNKLINIMSSGKFTIKFTNDDGGWWTMEVNNSSVIKNWIKILKDYKLLLSLY